VQALLGDFPTALDEAVMGSGKAHQNQMMQYLNSKKLQTGFQRVVLELLRRKGNEASAARERLF
jgi:type I restriction enzyme R subunit